MLDLCACGAFKKTEARTCLACYRALGQRSPDRPAIVRFWEKVDDSAGLHGCWLWRGVIGPNGYGKFYFEGRMQWAHRVAYLLLVGDIPDGMEVRHLECDNPPCVNARAHLALGTRMQNVQDSVGKGRHTFGARNPTAKLTADRVIAIRAEYAAGGVLIREIAAREGLSNAAIAMVIRRERWTHV
jgi:hypothetical protein